MYIEFERNIGAYKDRSVERGRERDIVRVQCGRGRKDESTPASYCACRPFLPANTPAPICNESFCITIIELNSKRRLENERERVRDFVV